MKTTINLIQNLININTSDPKNIDSAMKIICDFANKNGLHTKTFENTKAILIETNPLFKKHISFVCHIDVVPAFGWKQAFTPKTTANKIIGRGALDDKGPLGIILSLLPQMINRKANISLLIVTDEETTNHEIDHVLSSKKWKPQFCMVVDGGKHNTLDIGQKGNISVAIKAKTSGGHSAFEKDGENAANTLMRFINRLSCHIKTPTNNFLPTFINTSHIKSLSQNYAMPKKAKANIQICFSPPETINHWIKVLHKEVKRFSNQISFEITWKTKPHMLKDKKWINFLNDLTTNIRLETSGGNNMAKNIALRDIPSASHCPTDKYLAHCKNESIKISDLEKGFIFYKKIIKDFEKLKFKK